MSFIAFKSNVSNGWVRVKWAVTNIVGEYRLGAEGAVEVVASKLENGGQVYADHLPVVGEYVMSFPGPKALLSMKFILLINTEMAKINGNFRFKSPNHYKC